MNYTELKQWIINSCIAVNRYADNRDTRLNCTNFGATQTLRDILSSMGHAVLLDFRLTDEFFRVMLLEIDGEALYESEE